MRAGDIAYVQFAAFDNREPKKNMSLSNRFTIIITDPGTLVRLSNDFGSFGDDAGAFFRAGRNDGETGRFEVLNQARVEISVSLEPAVPPGAGLR